LPQLRPPRVNSHLPGIRLRGRWACRCTKFVVRDLPRHPCPGRNRWHRAIPPQSVDYQPFLLRRETFDITPDERWFASSRHSRQGCWSERARQTLVTNRLRSRLPLAALHQRKLRLPSARRPGLSSRSNWNSPPTGLTRSPPIPETDAAAWNRGRLREKRDRRGRNSSTSSSPLA